MDNDNNKYDIDSPANMSLSSLIDQDLQKESELLQNLIKEVVQANDTVKASNKKRLEESNEKLTILNQEIKRLRTEISQKDEQITLSQFDHLIESKDRIHQSLRTMRMHPLDFELSKDSSMNVNSLQERLLDHIQKHAQLTTAPSSFMKTFEDATAEFTQSVFDVAQTFFKSNTRLSAIHKANQTFKTASNTFLQTLEKQSGELITQLNARDHVLEDGSDFNSLDKRVESTYKEKVNGITQKMKALETAHTSELKALEEKLEKERNAIETKLKKKYKHKLDNQQNGKTSLEEELKTLKIEIIRAEKAGETEKLKELLKTYNKLNSKKAGLTETILQDKVDNKLKRTRTRIIKAKRDSEKTYAKKRNALELEKSQIDLQFNNSHEHFKVQGDYDALKNDLSMNASFESLLLDTTNAYKTLLNQALTFSSTLEKLMFDTKIGFLEELSNVSEKLTALKTTFKKSQIEMANKYKKVAFKQSKAQKNIQSVIRKQTLNMYFHNEENKADNALIEATNNADIEKTYQQENAKNDLIYQQGLIELADKEYELQLLKIRSLYDNEILLTKAQAERLNVGSNVNDSMISTTLESQMNFARQQIKYAENEYQVRLENIEAALNREVEYAQEKLNQKRQVFQSDIHELRTERDRKLDDLSYRQALFTDPKDKRKLKEKENHIRSSYNEKIEVIENKEANDEDVIRYTTQIENAKKRADKAREDARQLKEKSITTFRGMLEQTNQKLDAFKSSSSGQKQLGNSIEDEASKTAMKRYKEAIEEANSLYQEKVKGPKEKIKSLKATLESIEFDETTQRKIEEKKSALEKTRTHIGTLLDKEKAQTDEALEAIEAEMSAMDEKAENIKEKISVREKNSSVKRDVASLKTALKRVKKNRPTVKRDALQKSLTTLIKDHEKVIESNKSAMDKALKPALKDYEQFLKKVSVSQNKAFKHIEKISHRRLKDQLKEIDERYKNLL